MQEGIESHLPNITRSKTGGQSLVKPRELLERVANGENSAERVCALLNGNATDVLFQDPEDLPENIRDVYFLPLNRELNYNPLQQNQ